MLRGAVFLVFSLILASTAGAREPLVACYESKGWDHYVIGDSEEIPERPGIMIELVREAAARSGIAVDLIRRPWKRCLLNLENSAVDAVIGGSYLLERALYAHYPKTANGMVDESRALHFSSYYLFTRRGSGLRWDGETLSGVEKPLGASLGYSIVNILKNQGFEVREFTDVDQGFLMVQRDRLDGYVTFDTDAEPILQTGQYDIIQLSPPYRTRAYYLMFSRNFYDEHSELAEAIWTILPRLRSELEPKLRMEYRNLIH